MKISLAQYRNLRNGKDEGMGYLMSDILYKDLKVEIAIFFSNSTEYNKVKGQAPLHLEGRLQELLTQGLVILHDAVVI